MYEFDWSSIVPSLPYLLDGLVITLKITVTAVVIGILWGTMLAVMRLSSFAPVAWFAKAYVNVFRSIPLVMVLLWFSALFWSPALILARQFWQTRKVT